MPFDFLAKTTTRQAATGEPAARRLGTECRGSVRRPPAGRTPRRARRPARGVPFDGLTEEWRLVGVMDVNGRLSDALNRRDAISIREVSWAPLDGSDAAQPGARAAQRRPLRPDRGPGR